jgi:uncharacterized protein
MQEKNLSDIYKLVWIVLIVLAVFLGVHTLSSLKSLKNPQPFYNTFTVTGEGEVMAKPDVATFSFSVSADAKTVSEAQSNITEKMDAILKELKAKGIDEKDIKTQDYSVWPKYTYVPSVCSPTYCPPYNQRLDGYTANHSVTVKVRDIDNAGTILSAAGDKGATNLSGISFTVDEPEKLLQEARTQAIEKAQEKAKVLARSLHVRTGRVVSYYDSTDGGYPRPMYADGLGGAEAMSSQKAPTLPTGENSMKVIVNITYELK